MKRATKKTSNLSESHKRSLKRLLRQMAWHDFEISLKDLKNGDQPPPIRGRIIE
jgi:hypothetical protein